MPSQPIIGNEFENTFVGLHGSKMLLKSAGSSGAPSLDSLFPPLAPPQTSSNNNNNSNHSNNNLICAQQGALEETFESDDAFLAEIGNLRIESAPPTAPHVTALKFQNGGKMPELVNENHGNNSEVDRSVENLQQEINKLNFLISEIYRYERKQQDLILKFIEALTIAKRDLEQDLLSNSLFTEIDLVNDEIAKARKFLHFHGAQPTALAAVANLTANLTGKQKRLEALLFRTLAHPFANLASATSQEHLKLIHSYACSKLTQIPSCGVNKNLLASIGNGNNSNNNNGGKLNLFLLNNNNGNSSPGNKAGNLNMLLKSNYLLATNGSNNFPKFFFDMEISPNACAAPSISAPSVPLGRIVIEIRPDVAPKMCQNFQALAENQKGYGYAGCCVFQAWKGESVILGDFEHNNGRGGHSVFENEPLFMPEDTRLQATRGSIGMRRTQKRHDSKGLVGSQFRIILQEMPGFTGIFGKVLEGIEIIDKISEHGDPSGNPLKKIFIKNCGKIV